MQTFKKGDIVTTNGNYREILKEKVGFSAHKDTPEDSAFIVGKILDIKDDVLYLSLLQSKVGYYGAGFLDTWMVDLVKLDTKPDFRIKIYDEETDIFCNSCAKLAKIVTKEGHHYCQEHSSLYVLPCDKCKQPTDSGHYADNHFLCGECVKIEGYIACKYCGVLHKKDKNHLFICKQCFNSGLKCTLCKEFLPNNESSMTFRVGEKVYCRCCFEENFKRCCNCHKALPNESAKETYRGRFVCLSCINGGSSYKKCTNCNKYCTYREASVDADNGNVLCPRCNQSETKEIIDISNKYIPKTEKLKIFSNIIGKKHKSLEKATIKAPKELIATTTSTSNIYIKLAKALDPMRIAIGLLDRPTAAIQVPSILYNIMQERLLGTPIMHDLQYLRLEDERNYMVTIDGLDYLRIGISPAALRGKHKLWRDVINDSYKTLVSQRRNN